MSSLLATQLRSIRIPSLLVWFFDGGGCYLSTFLFRAFFTTERHDEPVDNYDQFSVKFYPISLYL
jgi:hypothetical protein